MLQAISLIQREEDLSKCRSFTTYEIKVGGYTLSANGNQRHKQEEKILNLRKILFRGRLFVLFHSLSQNVRLLGSINYLDFRSSVI